MMITVHIKFHHNVYLIFICCLSTKGGGERPDQLMQVMLPLLDNEVCNQQGWYNFVVDDSMVCAGFEEGGRGSCNVSFYFT